VLFADLDCIAILVFYSSNTMVAVSSAPASRDALLLDALDAAEKEGDVFQVLQVFQISRRRSTESRVTDFRFTPALPVEAFANADEQRHVEALYAIVKAEHVDATKVYIYIYIYPILQI